MSQRTSSPLAEALKKGLFTYSAPAEITATPSPKPVSTVTPLPPPTLQQLCEAEWRNVASTNEADLQMNLERGSLLLSAACLRKMKAELKVTPIQSFVTHCQLELAGRDYTYIRDACVPLLPFFRAFLIRNLRIGSIDLDRLDTTDLANQLLGGAVDLRQAKEEDLQRNIRIAEELISRDPNFYTA